MITVLPVVHVIRIYPFWVNFNIRTWAGHIQRTNVPNTSPTANRRWQKTGTDPAVPLPTGSKLCIYRTFMTSRPSSVWLSGSRHLHHVPGGRFISATRSLTMSRSNLRGKNAHRNFKTMCQPKLWSASPVLLQENHNSLTLQSPIKFSIKTSNSMNGHHRSCIQNPIQISRTLLA